MHIRLADGVSLFRLVLLVPWTWLSLEASCWALLVMAAIAVTDLVDGPIARRLRTAGPRGQLLDAACDAVVAVTAGVVAGLRDARYLVFAGLAIGCLASWGARSAIAGRFAYTRIGKYDGAACFFVAILASARPLLPTGFRAGAIMEWCLLGATWVLLGVSGVENVAGLARERAA